MALTTFFDHLTALDSARWGTLTGGSGTVTQTGSRVELRSPSTTDSAAIYLKDTIDLSVSQIVQFCFSYASSVAGLPFHIINKASAPAVENQTAFDARRLTAATSADSVASTFLRWSSGGTQNSWSTSAANWSTGASRYSITPVGTTDYYIITFENDATNAQWRLHGHCLQGSTFGDGKTQGMVHVCTTDWTTWANTRTSTDGVYLVLGDIVNNANTLSVDVEWVRSSVATKEWAFINGKDDGGTYLIKRFWSFDGGKFLLPEDRSTSALTGNVKDPWVVDPGAGTVHLFYYDITTDAIRRATSSTIGGTFTDVNACATAPANHDFGFPSVVYTSWESAGYEWQMLVQDLDATDSNHISLRLFTTADPSTSGWTDRGIVLSYGSGADKDAQGCLSPVIQHRNGRYEVWYSGQYDPGVAMNGAYTTVSGMRATGSGLTSAGAGLLTPTKDGSGARLPYTDAQQALSANLSGITASMADTDGFEFNDMPVFFDQDTTDNNWALSRIKSYTVDTSLVLYHKMTGLTTAAGAVAFGPLSGPQNIRSMKQQADGSWHVFVTICQLTKFNTTIGAVFAEYTFLLVVPAGTDLTNMTTSMYSWIDSPTPYLNTFGFGHSAENLSLVYGATTRTYPARPVFRQAARFITRSF